MLTHFITWAGRRLAQFIKYLRFSFRGYSWLYRDGAVASDSPNPESRLYFRPISLRQMYGTPQDFYVKNERYQLLA